MKKHTTSINSKKTNPKAKNKQKLHQTHKFHNVPETYKRFNIFLIYSFVFSSVQYISTCNTN